MTNVNDSSIIDGIWAYMKSAANDPTPAEQTPAPAPAPTPEPGPEDDEGSWMSEETAAKLLANMEQHADRTSDLEIIKLLCMLLDAGIPCKFTGFQVVYYGHAGPPKPKSGCIFGPGWGSVCSVISFGYGRDEGLLEAKGLLWDANGWLTASDIFPAIKEHWDREAAEGAR